jgi:hypothetical protein
MKNLQNLSNLDKQEQAKREKNHDSVANTRDFGCKSKTWSDIGVNLNKRG